MRKKLEQWHKEVADIAGQISLRLTKGKGLTRGEIENWQRALNAVSVDMRNAKETLPQAHTSPSGGS